VLVVLRFIGIFNAAIWLGAAVFFTFGVQRGVFSPEMKKLFPGEYTGYIGQALIERYFVFSLVCCLIAIGHFFAEMVYAGKPFRRFTFALLLGALALGLLGSYGLSPKIKEAHQIRYRGTVEQRPVAEQRFKRLHAISATSNLLVLLALVVYTWQVTNPSDPMRFVGTAKFRG
jgi:hypothetical protein